MPRGDSNLFFIDKHNPEGDVKAIGVDRVIWGLSWDATSALAFFWSRRWLHSCKRRYKPAIEGLRRDTQPTLQEATWIHTQQILSATCKPVRTRHGLLQEATEDCKARHVPFRTARTRQINTLLSKPGRDLWNQPVQRDKGPNCSRTRHEQLYTLKLFLLWWCRCEWLMKTYL